MQTLLNHYSTAITLFAQAEETVAEDAVNWSMSDAVLIVILVLLALTAVCKSSQRH